MRLYTVDIKGKLIDGVEVDSDTSFLRCIKCDDGTTSVMPISYKVWDNKEERTIDLFVKNAHKKLSLDEVVIRYNLTKEEAEEALEKALDKFPEKFI